MKFWSSEPVLKRVNNVLLILIVICCGYVIIAPIIPAINGWQRRVITKPVHMDLGSAPGIQAIDRSTNRLIIPKMQLEKPIVEGVSESTVHRGIWRRPNSSTPDKGGNTVMVGHRFTYAGASVFYDLDKMAVGDEVVLTYGGIIYRYQVFDVRAVSPDQTSIESNTSDERLTLYTCTPMWSTKQRLVVSAGLKEKL